MYYIIGLGNPGKEYENSRHSAGRMAVFDFAKKSGFGEFELDKKLNALVAEGEVGGEKVTAILPETFMNKSGNAVKPLIGKLIKKKKVVVNGKKKEVFTADNMVVLNDDLDIGIGNFKISYGKSAGGHKGVDSVAKAVKTLDFPRVRVGVSPVTPKGKVKRPSSDEMVDFIIGKFKPAELETFKKTSKKISEALEMMISEGKDRAMSEYN